MKTIITELTANNQVIVRYVNRPNCLPAPNLGDKSAERELTQLSKYQQKVERIHAIVRNASIEYLHDNSACMDVKRDIELHHGACAKVGEIFSMSRYKGYACTVPNVVTYRELINNKLTVVQKTPSELFAERKATLDIIKKSQQRVKRERSWGKLQTDKSFTRNAKQKILECGAVIDKHVGNTNAFALTLTIPGSGWDVYDVISRWSGYIVNRLTQIIRRAESKGCKVHWFFVWEHQKRGALHMHWCIAVESNWRVANLLCLELRAKWFALLEELSVKTHTDLFKKRGFSGTWRHSPDVWQADIFRVKKSVAGYFSKYCSKGYDSNSILSRRRAHEQRKSTLNPNTANSARIYSLSPTRFWGCASRTKRLCARYKVTIRFDVANPREGDYIYQIIRERLSKLSAKLTEVSRYFKKVAPDTGFIYCSGWERKIWFDASVMDECLSAFKFLRLNTERKTDVIGALLNWANF